MRHGGAQAAPEDHDETDQHADGAEQAQFLAHHGINEIRMRFGQVEQLLPAVHQSDAR